MHVTDCQGDLLYMHVRCNQIGLRYTLAMLHCQVLHVYTMMLSQVMTFRLTTKDSIMTHRARSISKKLLVPKLCLMAMPS